ncbi:hypothetical protein ABZ499_32150 [Streptomyces sp. NPDC019990]|uniref:hypothetical protein n=1 Tax=Streptomyces sp. NPDC019990 TaxID=3154693 RepID=UPI0033F35E8B
MRSSFLVQMAWLHHPTERGSDARHLTPSDRTCGRTREENPVIDFEPKYGNVEKLEAPIHAVLTAEDA